MTHPWNRLALAALLTVALGPPAAAAPVFYCDRNSAQERAEEIRVIRTEYLPGLKEIIEGPPGLGDRAHAAEEFKEWAARLAELELGDRSCRELREVEAERRRPRPPPEDDLLIPPRPPSSVEDDLLIPPTPPPAAEDDLLVPPIPPRAEDDLLVPPTPPPRRR